TGFGDGSWASGPARLGFGGDGEVTMVSYGPDPNNKYVTTYFRKSFYVTNSAALTTLTLNLLRDDGAVVYLNGVEVRRDNMPAGADLTISADASDSDGAITKVEFFQGGIKLGKTATSPYSVVWNSLIEGQYPLTAVATDNDGAATISAPVTITVEDANPPVLL